MYSQVGLKIKITHLKGILPCGENLEVCLHNSLKLSAKLIAVELCGLDLDNENNMAAALETLICGLMRMCGAGVDFRQCLTIHADHC